MQTITIDSRDLSYTIDTYGMFTGESTQEGEEEYYTEEYKLTEAEQEKIEFDYDHKGVVKELAIASVQLLHENFVQHGNGIVKEIELVKETSPQFYNYTTDAYTADWTLNIEALKTYIVLHQGEYNNFERDNWYSVYDSHGTENFNEDNYIVAMLDFYTQNEYDREDYEMSMFEYESQAWTENMKPTEEFQKILNTKETK